MRKNKRNKKKKKVLRYFLITGLIVVIGLSIYLLPNNNNKDIILTSNKNHFSEYVVTNKDAKLYQKENDQYVEVGIIGEKNELKLNKEKSDKEYFNINNIDGTYFIKNSDVNKIDKLSEYDDRYKNYILFNYNVETKETTNFYDEDDNLVYSLNEKYSLPLIIKDEDKYGVEFDNRLLYIKKDNADLVENHNTNEHNASGVGVLNYHAFYDEDDPEDACPTEICHSKKQFREQLEFLKENNILTLKMKELENYVDGKINLPKSVLITIDDGSREKVGIDLLTEYKMYGTIFLVTSWFDESEYYKTDYIELHSHTHDMHDGGKCPGGQGGAIKCLSEEEIQKDLKQSREELNGSTYFAYPFYEYNEYSIEMLKKAGFTMAFIGESNNSDNLVHVGSDKFRLRRFVIVTYTTIADLEKYFNLIK